MPRTPPLESSHMLTLKGEAGRSPTTQEEKKQNRSKQLKVHVTKEPLFHLLGNNNNKKTPLSHGIQSLPSASVIPICKWVGTSLNRTTINNKWKLCICRVCLMPMFGPQGRELNFGTRKGNNNKTKGFLWLRAWGQGWPLGSISIGCPSKKSQSNSAHKC